MYFNDSTSIILSADETTFDYLAEDGEATSGAIGTHPALLDKKIKLSLRYKGYMADKLQAEPPTDAAGGAKVFLADFKRSSNAVLFRLSDGVFQMNFGDHSKLVLWDGAKAVRYVDKRGGVHVMGLADAVSRGPKFEVIERLKVVAGELFGWADGLSSEKRIRK
jgi:POLO box duplicated region